MLNFLIKQNNKFPHKLILFSLINIITFTSYSQFYNSGNEYFKIKWNFIKNEKFKIIFPEKSDSIAFKTIEYLNNYSSILDTIYNTKKLYFPIIIHKNSTISNGFVTYGPKRSEFFIFPYPFNFPGSDLKILSSHEIIHMYQTTRMNNGFTKFLNFFLGDASLGYTFLNIPYWFFEGEAVFYETNLNISGRGNLSIFKDQFKSYIIENPETNYDKSYFGSYKTFVPGVYHLGYFMVDNLYRNFHYNIGSKLIHNSGKNSFIPHSFNFYLKKLTNRSTTQIFENIKDSIIKEENYNNNYFDTIQTLSIINKKFDNKDYLSFHSINIIGDTKIIALKKDFDKIPEIILYDINTKNINIIYKTNNIYPDYLHANNEYVTWSEIKPHHRYDLLNYSIIKIYNLKSNKYFIIDNKTKYIFPYISKNSKYLLFIEIDKQLNKYLILYDLKNKKIIEKIRSVNNSEIQFPVIDDNEENIFVITNSDSGKCIYKYNILLKSWNKILGPTFNDISNLFVYKNLLFFNSNITSHENIFLLNIQNNKFFQVTNNKHSSSTPKVNNNVLYFTYLTNKGWKIGFKTLDTTSFTEISLPINQLKKIQNFEFNNNKNHETIKIKKYSKTLNIFKFHTWLPLFINAFDLDNFNIKPGISLFSQDFLNTTFLQFSIYREFNKNYFFTHFNYSNFPIIFDCEVKYGGTQKKVFNNESDILKKDLNVQLSFYYPINLSSNIFYKHITTSYQLYYKNLFFNKNEHGVWFSKYSITISNYKYLAYRNISPEIGFILQENFINSLDKSKYYNYLNAIIFKIFLPGLQKHHAFRINFSHQLNPVKHLINNNNKYSIFIPFSIVNFPDSYTDYIAEIKSNENIKFSFEYMFPLFYPDLNIPGIIFLKRIKSSIYYNYFISYNAYVYFINNFIQQMNNLRLKTLSFQLSFDTHLLRLYIPFELKYNINYLFNYKKINMKFGITANFYF